MVILGLSAYAADASAAILVDGRIVAAIEEERLLRRKHWAGFPRFAMDACLDAAGLRLQDVDHIAVGHDPRAHIGSRIMQAVRRGPALGAFAKRMKSQLVTYDARDEIGLNVGLDPKSIRARTHSVEHHAAHLASAFFASGFDTAAVVSLDAFGDYVSAMWARGEGNQLAPQGTIRLPHSLGLFYAGLCQHLGFPRPGDEDEVMWLSTEGSPEHAGALRRVLRVEDGEFRLDLSYFRHRRSGIGAPPGSPARYGPICTPRLAELVGPARGPGSPIDDHTRSLAASLQVVFEEALFAVLAKAHEAAGRPRHLALAGGCAFNALAIAKIRDQGLFDEVFVQPAAGTAGTSLGAALHVHHVALGRPRASAMRHAYLGPRAAPREIDALLREKRVTAERLADPTRAARVAEAIAAGHRVGLFQGSMEWGPRGLGNRVVLSDPRLPVPARGAPHAAALPIEAAADFAIRFDADPFVTRVAHIRPERRAALASVIRGGACRLHAVSPGENALYYDILRAVGDRTGAPVVACTTFEDDAPLPCSARDALEALERGSIDALLLEHAWIAPREKRAAAHRS